MSDNTKKFYLTTPIYYVNARPHIGHAYTTIVADVIARRHRLLGDDTFFLTGTDEHGQKIERSAAAAGIPPQQFADQVSAEFRNLWDRMGLTYDDYIRTTEPRHTARRPKALHHSHDRGAIYLSSYTGQYSVGDEIFVDGPPGTLGPDGKPTETVTEENFFFKLSDYQHPLIDLIETDTLSSNPKSAGTKSSASSAATSPLLHRLMPVRRSEASQLEARSLRSDLASFADGTPTSPAPSKTSPSPAPASRGASPSRSPRLRRNRSTSSTSGSTPSPTT